MVSDKMIHMAFITRIVTLIYKQNPIRENF